MTGGAANWRKQARRVAKVLTLLLPLVCCAVGPAHAQGAVFRPPTINVPPRLPQINPNLAGTATVRAVTPNLNVRQGCSYAYRSSNGECSNDPGSTAGRNGSGNGNGSAGNSKSGGSRSNVAATPNLQAVTNELVAELNGNLTEAQADTSWRNHRPFPHHRRPFDGCAQAPIRCQCECAFGSAQLPLFLAG
jgi:hypothetical protein